MQCPECQATVSDSISACPDCGYLLPVEHETQTCSECQEIMGADDTVCPQCGFSLRVVEHCPECNNMLEDGAKSCTSCGYGSAESLGFYPAKTRDRTTLIGSLITIGILGGVLIIFLLIKPGNRPLLSSNDGDGFLSSLNWFAADRRAKISSVKANMHTLQTMIETYAVDWGGVYANNLQQLHNEANESGKSYWKDFENPYTGKTGIGAKGSVIDGRDFQIGMSPGLVIYLPVNLTEYQVFGTDEKGNVIQSKGTDFALNNGGALSFEDAWSTMNSSFQNRYIASSNAKNFAATTNTALSATRPEYQSELVKQIQNIPNYEITATASSSIHMTLGRATVDFTPEKVLDNDSTTNWQENSTGSGFGEWLQLSFSQSYDVQSLEIRNGYAETNNPKYGNLFEKNNRVHEAKIIFSNGVVHQIILSDDAAFHTYEIPSNGLVNWVRLTIESVYKGRKYDDTCISDINVKAWITKK